MRSTVKILAAFLFIFSFNSIAIAKLKIITTTMDLADVVSEVGGIDVEVESLCKGTEDPHSVDIKPSFIFKAAKADGIIAIGLNLEASWLPKIIAGAQGSKIGSFTKGYLEVGPKIDPIEVGISDHDLDSHPLGNPHFMLDPIRVGQTAVFVAEFLGQYDGLHSKDFLERAKKMQQRLSDKTKNWAEQLSKVPSKNVITYHKTLDYFLARFGFKVSETLETKPGSIPTASHIRKVLKAIDTDNVRLILVEKFFDPRVAERLKQEKPQLSVVTVPTSVGAQPEIHHIDDLFDLLVRSIVSKN